MALLLTFISGLFFLVGLGIKRMVKDNTKLTVLSIACATVILIGLISFDIIPEIIEMNDWKLWIFVLIGLIILIMVDKLIPNHEHHHHENDEEEKEHQEHIIHISTITIIALLLHNFIEGMALYSVATNDLKSGLLMLFGVGLHNLPFGFQIASYKDNIKSKFLILLLVLSGFFGGLLFIIFGGVSEFIEGMIISLTLGMLLHIFLFELLKEVLSNIKKKETIYGIIIGIILLIIINLL